MYVKELCAYRLDKVNTTKSNRRSRWRFLFRTLATTHLVEEILLGLIIGAIFWLDLGASAKFGEFHQVRIHKEPLVISYSYFYYCRRYFIDLCKRKNNNHFYSCASRWFGWVWHGHGHGSSSARVQLMLLKPLMQRSAFLVSYSIGNPSIAILMTKRH